MLLALPFLALSLLSVTPQTQDEQALQKFYSEIWSPYCKGNSLLECPSGQATELRDRIRQAREAGMSFDQIKADLEVEYGKSLSMTPQVGARGRMAYWIPWIALFAIFGVLAWYWKSRIRTQDLKPTATSEKLSDEIESQIAERLK